MCWIVGLLAQPNQCIAASCQMFEWQLYNMPWLMLNRSSTLFCLAIASWSSL